MSVSEMGYLCGSTKMQHFESYFAVRGGSRTAATVGSR